MEKERLEEFYRLKTKVIALKSIRDSTRGNLVVHRENLDALSKEADDLHKNLSSMDEAYLNLKLLIEKYSMKHIREVEQMVTFGLQTIFHDEDYSFKIQISDQRNSKYAEFFLVEHKDGVEICTPLKSDRVAGGILVVCGFILQVYFIQYFGLANLIVADECFSQLSSSYINGLFTFIDRLKQKMNLIIILVTHDERFVDYADKVFIANKGEFILKEQK